MQIPLLILRPEPGNAATLTAARAMGLEAWGFPLFAVAPVSWAPVPVASFDALLLGSANAIAHAGPALAAYAGAPAWVVGKATAEAARSAGIKVIHQGSGGLQAVLDAVPSPMHLLRLAGQAHVPLAAPPGVAITTRIVYDARALPLPDGLARLLTTAALPGFVALIHSAEAARHFAAQCTALDLPRARITCITMGPRVSAALGGGWAKVITAPAPDDGQLLALAAQLCQKRNGS